MEGLCRCSKACREEEGEDEDEDEENTHKKRNIQVALLQSVGPLVKPTGFHHLVFTSNLQLAGHALSWIEMSRNTDGLLCSCDSHPDSVIEISSEVVSKFRPIICDQIIAVQRYTFISIKRQHE
ncbi:hypothetical protein T07_7534 [Trichinella nelsoni]|uniref:Uncharacterized protein n=1 Tax=Trichinella nelsoni TaxID=6336 RepID=A0A0V0RU34_9BILA|nr:hypothetical protein T07_7534 [Trichinella nelsoni]